MAANRDRETEVKFYLADPPAFEKRLRAAGAERVHPRTHEYNLRFDTPEGGLRRRGQVLRLRRDDASRLTYKGPSDTGSGATSRREIEFTVSDYGLARNFIESLGYRVYVAYEKYRTTYALGDLEVVLDEMPYGHFTEIEGADAESIRAAAEKLGLAWERRILASYLALFERVKGALALDFQDLTFENFKSLQVKEEDFGLDSLG